MKLLGLAMGPVMTTLILNFAFMMEAIVALSLPSKMITAMNAFVIKTAQDIHLNILPKVQKQQLLIFG